MCSKLLLMVYVRLSTSALLPCPFLLQFNTASGSFIYRKSCVSELPAKRNLVFPVLPMSVWLCLIHYLPLEKGPVFCLGMRTKILIYWVGWGGLSQEEPVNHGCMISGFPLCNNSLFPQSFPVTQPGCWQLSHHDFCNDGKGPCH